jgi:hypothetical protein
MATIIDLFTQESKDLIFYNFPDLKNQFKTCWYPSAYYDFRPINYWQEEENMIFVHNDILALNEIFALGHPNPIFRPGIFNTMGMSTTSHGIINIVWYWELQLNEICWNPNLHILNFGIDGKKRPKVYLFEVESVVNSKRFPLIYLSFENTNFFYDYLIHDKIQIDILVHVNDGGASLGGSSYKMDYIYPYLDDLGISEIMVDYTFEEKKPYIIDFLDFKHYSPPSKRIKSNLDVEEDIFRRRDFVRENRRGDYEREIGRRDLERRMEELDRQHDRDLRNNEIIGMEHRNFNYRPEEDPRILKLFTHWTQLEKQIMDFGNHYIRNSSLKKP